MQPPQTAELDAGYLVVIFDPEDEVPSCTAPVPEDSKLHSYRRENLISYSLMNVIVQIMSVCCL
jgi:hypothetical protein